MNDDVGSTVLNGLYSVYRQVRGFVGGPDVKLGRKGVCRFCGTWDPRLFRKIAHTIPEALGNKWVFSQDECDSCNALFSRYDDALAVSVSPILTVGGTKGKGCQVRQTGRTVGDTVLVSERGEQRRQILARFRAEMPHEHIEVDPVTNKARFDLPVAGVPFRPRHAYKALSKIGFALLPEEDLADFEKLRDWLQDVDDVEGFPFLDVGLSFGSLGNAPPLVAATLLKRADPAAEVPYMVFLLTAGSVCWQIDLMPDRLDCHLSGLPFGVLNIEWSTGMGDGTGQAIWIRFGKPVHRDWSSSKTEAQPISSLVLEFDPATEEGRLTPVFR